MIETPTPRLTTRPVRRARAARLTVPRGVGFVATSASLVAFFVAAGAPTPLLPLYEHAWGFAPSLLTVAFGVYALALVASLLVAGSLSDYVGRRPVLVAALALELVAVIVFVAAGSIGALIVGRILQGIATGIASSAFGAAAVELASERQKKVGALMTSLASTAGLGVGALFSGLVALAIPESAAVVVWAVLAVIMAAGTILAILTPETSTPRPGALGSLVPRFAVPSNVRHLFAVTAPSVASAFLLAGFVLGLAPTVLAVVFGVHTPLLGGLLTFVVFGAAAVVSVSTSAIHPHRLKIVGNASIAVGAIALLLAVATGAVALVWIGAVIAGSGLGSAFSGSTRGLVPEVAPHERAGLFAAIFFVAYITLGGSAIVAGFIGAAIGVATMAGWFTAVLAAVAVVALMLSAGLVRRPSAA